MLNAGVLLEEVSHIEGVDKEEAYLQAMVVVWKKERLTDLAEAEATRGNAMVQNNTSTAPVVRGILEFHQTEIPPSHGLMDLVVAMNSPSFGPLAELAYVHFDYPHSVVLALRSVHGVGIKAVRDLLATVF
ncbi:hypothetical protein C8R43DRAFT_1129410 [Mycena crocata]|nr:hypothetical protein C8R43DRAFT_1129410 [Mycena crocata]